MCCVGAVVVLSAFALLWHNNSKSVDVELRSDVEGRTRTMQVGLGRYEDIVPALRIYLSNAREFPGTRKFNDFASGLLTQYDGVQALVWAPRVTAAERADFEARARQSGMPDFRITERTQDGRWIPAGDRDDYFPVFGDMQIRDEQATIGFDEGADLERRRTLERARDTAKPAATPVNQLFLPERKPEWGVLIVWPVYAEGARSATVDERRAGLIGLAIGVFRVGNMLEAILNQTTVPVGLDQYFFDGPAPDAARLIHIHQSRLRTADQAPAAYDEIAGRNGIRKTLTVADRRWTVVTVPMPGMYSHVPPIQSWGVLLAGFAATALATLYVRANILKAEYRADVARIIEGSPMILFRLAAEESVPLVYISDNVKRLGYRVEHLLALPRLWQQAVYPDDRAILMARIRDVLEGRSDNSYQEFRWIKPDGSLVFLDGHVSAMHDSAHRLVALEGTIIDISERKAAQDKVAELARTDAVTTLPNRMAFVEQLGTAFAAAKRGGALFAVLYLDLDNFKDVNDTLGHPMGDKLLQTVALRLKNSVRESDVVARFGGDEFAVLQGGTTDPSDAGALAGKICKVLRGSYQIDGNDIRVTVSVGISIFDRELAGVDDMLTQADLALYRAKEAGRDRFAFHSEDMDRLVRERVSLSEDLRAALERGGELEVHYQPQVEIASGRIVGVEALVRWNHPKRGQIMPPDFIGVAEKTGTITALGRWVLDESCRQMSCWRNEGIAPPVIAVNISSVQFKTNSEFAKEVAEIVAKWGLSPSDLELELTESVLMETTQEHGGLLEHIRQSGMRISIDDFGTGYSSLDYLRNYQINRLKIAQQFIFGLPSNSGDVAITRATIILAHEFGIEVIAEGVETAEQAAFLVSLGCKYAQGYYFSRPVPADRATLLLRQGRIDVGADSIAGPP
jgi:diguanylate cyclase (GGDEF)-like protein/PAS domain S-box-containing protein